MADNVNNPAVTPTVPTSPLSVDEFASRIKAKYPEYAGLDNATLAQKVVAKYPEYQNKVALGQPSAAPSLTPATPPPPEGFLHSLGSVVGYTPENFEAAKKTTANMNPLQEAVAATTPHPLDMLKSGFEAAKKEFSRGSEEGKQAFESLQQGDIKGALGHTIGQVGHAGGTLAAPVFGENPNKAAEQFASGNVGGGLGTTTGMILPMVVADAVRPKTPPLAKVTTRSQEAAFNVLHPENAVGKESILPEVRNAAAQQGVGKVPKGRAGVELPQKVIQGSIDNHEAQVAAIKQPYQNAAFDPESAAQSAESKITDQMRNEAKSPNAKTAARAQGQIDDLQSIADRIRTAKTIADADQLRHALNDELNPELNKSAAAQDVSPAATQAKRVGASALRQSFYDRLADLSGRDDVRALAQREGALIEAKAGVTKTATNALKSKRNDLGSSPRIQAVANAAKKVNLAKPASTLSFLPDAIRAVIDPTSQTPVGQYQARVARSLGDLGPATPNAPLYQPPAPAGLLGPGATPLGPSSIQHPPLAPPPIASTFRAQRVGVTPPSASGTFEHVPYNSQANASELNGAVRVPQQIGAGPNIRGLLPPQVEGAIGLPEKSQSTLTNGRILESPASNEGVIPALIRDYINGPSEHPDITAMKNATTHNSPEQAAAFNEQGAQQLFGRPYGALSVPERLQAIQKGTQLQAEAMNTSRSSGHSNVGGGSLEEFNRGQTLKVNPNTGVTGVHGGSIDVSKGEAVLRQRPDGSLEVANNNSSVSDSEILKRFGRNAAETYGKPGRAPNTVELIHRSGEHGDVPLNRVADYLGSGEYRLAPRR